MGGENVKNMRVEAVPMRIFGMDAKSHLDEEGNLVLERLEGLDFSLEYEVGIDEAGRGPVLGPMVYSLVLWPKGTVGGRYKDSKTLSAEKRKALSTEILREKNSGYILSVLFPLSISINMLSNEKIPKKQRRGMRGDIAKFFPPKKMGADRVTVPSMNLNELAISYVVKMIDKVEECGIRISGIFVDTVGPAAILEQLIKKGLRRKGTRVTVSEKADSRYKVVSAASILAKVTRDSFLERTCIELVCKGLEIEKIGCGYPSDPQTKEWLRSHYDPVLGFSAMVRSSWKPAAEILQEHPLPAVSLSLNLSGMGEGRQKERDG
jgi:ribonuclease H2 subunit A